MPLRKFLATKLINKIKKFKFTNVSWSVRSTGRITKTVRLDEDLYKALKDNHLKISDIVNLALRRYLKSIKLVD